MSNSFETALENASTIPETYRNKTNAIYKLEAYEYGTYYSGKAAGWEEAIEFFTEAFNEYKKGESK